MQFRVKNIGGIEGSGELNLTIPGIFEDINNTWIKPDTEENITFNFLIPDDLEEKSYKVFYELNGKKEETSLFVQGAKIEVNASLDKNMYVENDNAILTIEVKNLRNFDLKLFSRVKFNDFDSVQNFNLTGLETKTLRFEVPIHFTGDKIFYSVYMSSGRALYINSIYAYEKPKEDSGITLYTDKQVYNTGENVNVFVSVAKDGILNLTAPDFATTKALKAGDSIVIGFTVPELKSGTYFIDYTFNDFSSSYPFDVNGYFARILEFTLDKELYNAGDNMNMKMLVEANRNFSGTVKMWVYGKEIEDSFEFDKDFVKGENRIETNRTLKTNWSGIHSIVYDVNANLSGNSRVFLASGAEFFDVVDHVPPLITITSPQNIVYSTSSVVLSFTIEDTSDIEWIGYGLDGAGNVAISGNMLLTNLANGVHTIVVYARDSAGNTGSASITFTVNAGQQDAAPPVIEFVTLDSNTTIANATINIIVMATDDIGVTEVIADGTNLTKLGDLWQGSIKAQSSVGSYKVIIKAKDVANNIAESSASYNVVFPHGGVSVAIIPKISTVTNGSSMVLTIKINSTQNFDDVFHVYMNNSALSASGRADMTWFNWTDKVIPLSAREETVIRLRVDLPSGIAGTKTFRIYANSTKWRSSAYDTGGLKIT